MDPSSGVQQHQEMSNYAVENMLVCPKTQQEDKKPKPQPQEALKCPRCDSTNTKFCYYNNYSLSQPRYFCKSCRRYWTKGGTLRNIPVGGGCRKNKRSLLSSPSSKFRAHQDPLQSLTPNGNSFLNGIIPSNLTYEFETNDLTLAIIQKLQKLNSSGHHLGFDSNHHGDFNMMGNSSTSTSTSNHYDFPLSHDAVQGHTSYSQTLGMLGSLRSSKLLDTQGNSQNLYWGLGDGGIAQIDNGGGAATMVKKEDLCIGRENENRVLWGCPWNNGDVGIVDVISGRGSNWNKVVGSSWQGLLNSPLM